MRFAPLTIRYGEGVNSPRLLLAAFPPEFADLLETPPAGWLLACTGVGAIAAATTTARLIAENHPTCVLFLGSCGAYDQRLALGDCLRADEVLSVSLDELEGRAYRPRVERIRWSSSWPLPFPPHIVAVPPAITQTEAGARRLAVLAAAEHLELSGVFAACWEAQVPVAGALVVVNRVGPMAHDEWRAHHAKGSRTLVAALRESGVLD